MVNKSTKKQAQLRQMRIFSEESRKQIVKEIETCKCTILEASREYRVSTTSIYNWLNRYSRYLQKNKVLVVEEKSEQYKSRELEQRVKELEAALGRKQMEIDMLIKLIEMAGKEYNIDLKKNSSKMYLNGSGLIKDSNTSM